MAICVGRLITRDTGMQVDPERALQLSSERYRPMLRLLSDEDLNFLMQQPGFRRGMEVRLRAQRYQIFKAYLHALDRDFRYLCAAIKTLIVQSHQDRPDLARALYRYELAFALGMLQAQFKMLFYRLGLGTVDAGRLVNLFDVTRRRLRELAPAVMIASL